MKKHLLAIFALQLTLAVFNPPASAQPIMTSAPTEAEKEAFYATTIENRTLDILKALNLSDAAKSNAVHDAMVEQYHALRVRDAAIDTRLKVDGKEVNYENRAAQLAIQSQPLHDQFLAKLSQQLTPEQVEQVKNLMTYNKVTVTYDAYCAIVPDLTEADKAKILELLKLAREEAIDGGSAPEKSAIFQKYKDQINRYLDAHGHDVAKAFKDWEAKNAAGTAPAK
jgi:hypothetical protein